MFLDEVFVGEFSTIDTLSTCTIAFSEVSTLTHEAWDYTMEDTALETKAFLTSAQGPEILCK